MCMSMLLCCSVTCWRDFDWAVCIYKNPMVLFLIFDSHFYFQLSREHSDIIYIFSRTRSRSATYWDYTSHYFDEDQTFICVCMISC